MVRWVSLIHIALITHDPPTSVKLFIISSMDMGREILNNKLPHYLWIANLFPSEGDSHIYIYIYLVYRERPETAIWCLMFAPNC